VIEAEDAEVGTVSYIGILGNYDEQLRLKGKSGGINTS